MRVFILFLFLFSVTNHPCYSQSGACNSALTGCDNYYGKELYDTCNYYQQKIRIPVIFHVTYRDQEQNISTQLILQELADLNADFLMQNADVHQVLSVYQHLAANPNIEFYLAPLHDERFSEPGIIRKRRGWFDGATGTSAVIDPSKYLNVYIYKRLGNSGAHTFDRPWSNPSSDAIYVNWNEVGHHSRILTHEAGHWLGLMHNFECGDCTDAGDGVADTPAQTQMSDGAFSIKKDDPSLFSKTCNEQPVFYHNFMDYSNFRRMFTTEQVKRMRIVITKQRPGLIQ